MIHTEELLDALEARLRLIPEWVAAMDGQQSRIRAFKPGYPENANMDDAVYKMERPGVLVTFTGGGPVDDDGGRIGHEDRVMIHVKFGAGQNVLALLKLFRSHVGASGVRLEFDTILDAYYPMNAPSFDVTQDDEGQDIYHITTGFVEVGVG